MPGHRFDIRPILAYSFVFTLTVLSRLVFSPLLLTIEQDLGMSHAQSGSLFLLMSLGYAPMIVLSGFVASAIRHRGAILSSLVVVAGSLVFLSRAQSLPALRVGMLLLGAGSGLYTASGIACLARIVPQEHWGKAMAVHEAAPNLASITAPLITVAFLAFTGWRTMLVALSATCVVAGITFLTVDRGSLFHGAAPRLNTVKLYFKNRNFLVLAAVFVAAACAALGTYSILPTYLVAERGLQTGTANFLVSASRIVGLGVVSFSGPLIDRLGFRRLILGTLFCTGVFTALLGITPKSALAPVVLLQPVFAVTVFPPALTALARIGPEESRNVGVSLTTPLALVFGGGLFPTILGVLGETGRFYVGFIVLGILLIGVIPLFRLFRPEPPTVHDE